MTRTPAGRAVRILAFHAGGDAYSDAFYGALRRHGLEILPCSLSGRWLLRHLRDADYAHLHFPSFLYDAPTRLRSVRAFIVFTAFLAIARLRGIRILWTVHNLWPHAPSIIPAFDRLGRIMVTRAAYRLFVHGPTPAAIVRESFPWAAHKIVEIQHGHWIGRFPDTMPRERARTELGLPDDAFVYLMIGQCRRYKNAHGMIEAFRALDEPGAVLLIAGRFNEPSYLDEIRALAAPFGDRVRIYPGFVPDDRLQVFLNAADVVVTPYLQILTSGSVFLAFSFGKPVVAPARGALNDVVNERNGVLYDPASRDGLRAALAAARTRAWSRDEIRTDVRQYDWEWIANRVIAGLAEDGAAR